MIRDRLMTHMPIHNQLTRVEDQSQFLIAQEKKHVNSLQDELGELTESINHMADSLQSMLEAKRQLLMAISHELRTPITKAKLRMEFMPESDEKDQLKEDINEIDLLISDLLEAERHTTDFQ